MDYLIILLLAGFFFWGGGERRRRGVYVNIWTTFLIFKKQNKKLDTQEHLVKSLDLVLWSI